MGNANARQKAAEARKAEEAAQKRRQRIINIAIALALVAAVTAIIGIAVVASSGNKEAKEANPEASAPQGSIPTGQDNQYGIPANDAPGKPVLAIWEDFQCPACGQFEQTFGPTVVEIADKGDAQVIWRSTSFLDGQFPGENSQRAAAAWGCAVDAGKAEEYHSVVFANQPQTEGDGWTQEQLIAFGDQAGISGDQKGAFDQCVTDKTYMSWAANGTATMVAEGVGGTPTLTLNGEELEVSELGSAAGLKKAVADAASGTGQ
jgi:protein-disulfide isomerase